MPDIIQHNRQTDAPTWDVYFVADGENGHASVHAETESDAREAFNKCKLDSDVVSDDARIVEVAPASDEGSLSHPNT